MTGDKASEGSGEIKGWVLYDASCAFCTQGMTRFARQLQKRGFRIEPLQTSAVRSRVPARDDELRRELHLLLANGRVLAGPEAYRHLLMRFWWGYPLFLASRVPLLNFIFDFVCRKISSHRFLLATG